MDSRQIGGAQNGNPFGQRPRSMNQPPSQTSALEFDEAKETLESKQNLVHEQVNTQNKPEVYGLTFSFDLCSTP